MQKRSGRFRVVEKFDEDLFLKISEQHIKSPENWVDNYTYSESEFQENSDYLKKCLEDNKLYLGVVEDGDRLVGFIWGDLYRDERYIYINSLWTDPEYRKIGIARLLKSEIEKFCMKHQYTEVRTSVSKRNIPMQKLNLLLGYIQSGDDMVKRLG